VSRLIHAASLSGLQSGSACSKSRANCACLGFRAITLADAAARATVIAPAPLPTTSPRADHTRTFGWNLARHGPTAKPSRGSIQRVS